MPESCLSIGPDHYRSGPAVLEKKLGISEGTLDRKTCSEYPVQVTPYYLSLIDKADPLSDPVGRQCLPDPLELKDLSSDEDPLCEEDSMPVPKLIRRYQDRAVLLTTNRCAVYCRFCLRKRYWKTGMESSDISDNELDEVIAFLTDNPEVKEVLVSGGDPLMLKTSRLEYILKKLSSVPSIEVLRLGSRIPVVLPERIDGKLTSMLSSVPGLWLLTHFNHPKELTDDSKRALKMFLSSGVPVLNQTVLLAGVNDNPEILEKLFRTLVSLRVKPHYLFHIDPVKGVRHFATGIERGIEILREFRKTLSSLAVPAFAIDLPEGGGKVSLQASYCDENGLFETLDGGKVPYSDLYFKAVNTDTK